MSAMVCHRQPHDCLLNNRLSRRSSKKTKKTKLRLTGHCVRNLSVTGEFPAQRASNAEKGSIWWRHHEESEAAVEWCFTISRIVWYTVYIILYGSWRNIVVSSGIGLEPNRRQAITWTNVEQDQWRHMVHQATMSCYKSEPLQFMSPNLRSIDVHDDVIKWKHFPRHWPFLRGIHRSPVDSSHKGQWRGALIYS